MEFNLNQQDAKYILSAVQGNKGSFLLVRYIDESDRYNILSQYNDIISKFQNQEKRAFRKGLESIKNNEPAFDLLNEHQEAFTLDECELILSCLSRLHKEALEEANQNRKRILDLYFKFENYIKKYKETGKIHSEIFFNFELAYNFKKVLRVKEESAIQDVNNFLLTNSETINYIDLKPYTTHHGSTYYILVYQEYILD